MASLALFRSRGVPWLGALRWVRAVLPRALHSAAIIGGWGFLTQGVAAWAARPDVVWPMSVGALLLSIAGWGHLRIIANAGVYTLSRRAKQADERSAT